MRRKFACWWNSYIVSVHLCRYFVAKTVFDLFKIIYTKVVSKAEGVVGAGRG